MSLFSVLSLSSNALNANQLGLRTVANNIANAQTEGYIRQDLVLNTAPAQRIGHYEVGTGVKVVGVQQQINELVAERLRHAKGDLAGASAHEEVFRELEALLGELEDSDLSSGLSRFFGSLHDVANQPDSVAVRNVAVLEASQLSFDIRRHDTQIRAIRSKVNDEIADSVADVNRLLNEIADLNLRISQTEGGLPIEKGAVGLRDQRHLALGQLSELLDIRTTEQASGAVTVHSNGEFLVFDGVARQLEVSLDADRGIQLNQVRIADTQAPVNTSSGRIGGLLAARDETLGGVIDRFDDIARTLIYEFNQVFTSGQGLEGYTELKAEHRITDSSLALDAAGLPFEPSNGTFKVITWNREQNQQETHEIAVRLNGLNDDTTLEDIRTAIDAIDGLVAEWGDDGKLSLSTDRSGLEFAFSDDTSGVVAALGMATFFTGYSAGTIDVSEAIRSSPEKFATSSSGFGSDSEIVLRLAELADRSLESQDGRSISESYELFTIGITQDAAAASAITEGATVFHNTIEAEHLSITGVSLDEEAVKMLAYQRAFQASARVIQTANSLLELLVSL